MSSVSLDVSVTAICCLKKFSGLVLVGLGNRLELYRDGLIISSKLIFSSSSASIHGFVELSDAGKILIYGAKQVCILELTSDSFGSSLETVSEDWIFAAKWMSEIEVLILTAHNRVLRLLVDNNEGTLRLSPEVIQCEEKCILYSGQIVDSSTLESEATILAGTVFRELIIWSVPKFKSSSDSSVLHRLSGHEGVIFSVRFCSESSLICTTSDDRTARLWSVESSNGNHPNWQTSKIFCSRILSDFHTSRIFSSVFFRDTLVTIGEDSSFCRWSIKDGEKLSWKRSAHDGAPLWSADLDPEAGLLYTGGGDGAVKTWPLEGLSLKSPSVLQYPSETGDYARLVMQFNSRILLCLTNMGKLLAFEEEGECQVVLSCHELSSYALMDVISDRLVFATLDGQIKLWKTFCIEKVNFKTQFLMSKKVYDGKIFSMAVLSETELLTCGQNGEVKLISIEEDSKISIRHTFTLPESKEQRWFSCATLILSKGLVVGDRCGSLHFYSLSQENSALPLKSLFKLHGRFGIGSVTYNSASGLLSTAGRDGKIQTFEVDEKFLDNCVDVEKSLRQGGTTRLKFAWLEKIVNFERKTFILGFHSDQFVVYNLTDQSVSCEMSCGGSHRSWTFRLDRDTSFTFTFVKEKAIEQFSIPVSSLMGTKALRPALHSLEINCVKTFELCNQTFLVIGSEDTKIKIFQMDDKLTRKCCVATLNTHISSVKCLAVVDPKTADGSVYVVSAGSRAQLKIWWVSSSNSGSAISVAEVNSHLLKGDDKRRKKTWRDQELINDAETRYMDVACFEDGEQFEIVLACSDGLLRKFGFSKDQLHLLMESQTPETHAFLRVIKCDEMFDFLTSSTNGNIGFWTRKNLIKLKEISVHASGINSMLWSPTHGILTGGDDGALGFNPLQNCSVLTPDQISLNPPLLQKCSHSAHITGMVALDADRIFTCSVDQRVSLWKISSSDVGGEKNVFELIWQSFSNVPDLHDMVTLKKEDHVFVVVVGAGMQIFKLKL